MSPDPADRAPDESGTRIRRVRHGDLDAWVELLVESTIATYDFGDDFVSHRRSEMAAQRRETTEILSNPAYALWLAEDGDGILGVAETGPPQDWETELGFPPPPVDRQLIKLYLHPRAQGRRIGRTLLEAAMGDDAAYLWVFATNRRAVDFYRRYGFVDQGIDAVSGPDWGNAAMLRMYRPRDHPRAPDDHP